MADCKFPSSLFLLFGLLLVLNFCDSVVTMVGVSSLGIGAEGNPLMAGFIGSFGLFWFFVFKNLCLLPVFYQVLFVPVWAGFSVRQSCIYYRVLCGFLVVCSYKLFFVVVDWLFVLFRYVF